MNFVDSFDPSILLGDRLGLSLYCMFVEAYLSGEYSLESGLYRKFIRHFPGEAGKHTPEKFIQLIERVKSCGFDAYHPVYANPTEYSLVEGSHRCSIAIVLAKRDVPYNLRFADDRTDESVFRKIFTKDELELLHNKRDEYIGMCLPEIALKNRIRLIVRANPDSFKAPFSSKALVSSLRPYQAFESIGVAGKRPSAKRVEIYELNRYLRPEMRALEIGCNVGFFTMNFSQLLDSVTAFDVDSAYIKVANLVKEQCRISNCTFEVKSIKEYKPLQQYDFLVSTAIHGWSGISFNDYISLIDRSLTPGGVILFESHEIDTEKDWPDKRGFLTGRFDLVDSGLIDDVDKSIYGSEMREFLILKKREV